MGPSPFLWRVSPRCPRATRCFSPAVPYRGARRPLWKAGFSQHCRQAATISHCVVAYLSLVFPIKRDIDCHQWRSPEITPSPPKFPSFEGWSWVPKRLRLAPSLPTSWFCRIRGPSHEAPGVGLPVADVLAHAVELASARKTKTDC